MVKRQRGTATGVSQGIVASVTSCGAIGLRLAGSPHYAEGDHVELTSLENEYKWTAEAAFAGEQREVIFFKATSSWYCEERRSSARYPTHMAVTVVAPSEAYLARGTALDLSEGGMKVAVPEEPAGKDVRVVLTETDGLSLPCHIVGISYGDDGVQLHLAFGELPVDASRFVQRRLADLKVIAERGRNLLGNR